MSELSPKARALIQKSRTALRPTAEDRARIEAALQAKLRAHTQVTDPPPWPIVAGAAVGLCLLGGIAWQTSRPASQPARPVTITAAEPRVEPVVEPPAPEPAAPPSAATIDAPKPKPRAKDSADQLKRELELLTRATRLLRAGDASAALKTLETHQRRFPEGLMRQERSAAKAQALCRLGRVQEGQAELEHLPPDAPATARARERCGF